MANFAGNLWRVDRLCQLGQASRFPVLCGLILLQLAACGHDRVEVKTLLPSAEAHIGKLEWDRAIPLLKQYLSVYPEDGRAHFQLGRCYLNGSKLTPYAAEGEFRIALDAYEKNGRKSLFKENTDAFFPIRCYLEISKVYMKLCVNGLDDGLPLPLLEDLFRRLQRCANDAAALDPKNPDVVALYQFIETLSHSLDALRTSEPAPVHEGFVA